VDRLSHDFYWYSPVLRPRLADKTAGVVVLPVSEQEVLAVMRFAGRHEIRWPRLMRSMIAFPL
jgi:FAD/FMN-containing dehydrogenase